MSPLVSTTCCLVIVASTGSSAIDFGRVAPLTNSFVNPRSARAAVLHERAAANVTTARILLFISLPYLQLRRNESKPAHHDRTIGSRRRLLDVIEISLGRVARALLLLVDFAETAVRGRERGVGCDHALVRFLGALQVRGVRGTALFRLERLGQTLRARLASAIAQVVPLVGIGQRCLVDRALRAHTLPGVAEQVQQLPIVGIALNERLGETDGRGGARA